MRNDLQPFNYKQKYSGAFDLQGSAFVLHGGAG